MRLPRKLKKGCRTLNGNPRTKWQRKGRIHIAQMLDNVAKTACAAAVGMDLLRQAAERIHPVTLPPGGIVVEPPPKVGVATGEMVMSREQIGKLKHAILVKPADSIRTTISAENMSDVLKQLGWEFCSYVDRYVCYTLPTAENCYVFEDDGRYGIIGGWTGCAKFIHCNLTEVELEEYTRLSNRYAGIKARADEVTQAEAKESRENLREFLKRMEDKLC